MAGKIQATEEQKRYATVLDLGMKIGLLILTATFILYMIGVPGPNVPLDEVSDYWGLKVGDYLTATGIEPGWSWLTHLNQSDFLNFLPIAFLAAVTAVCYATIVPILFRKKDSTFAVLAILEIAVLALAASGVLPSGGH